MITQNHTVTIIIAYFDEVSIYNKSLSDKVVAYNARWLRTKLQFFSEENIVDAHKKINGFSKIRECPISGIFELHR